MKCTTTFKFYKCGFHTALKIRKPALFSPVIFNFECKGCSSRYLVRCTSKPSLGDAINVQAAIQKMSPDLKAIIEEDELLNPVAK